MMCVLEDLVEAGEMGQGGEERLEEGFGKEGAFGEVLAFQGDE